MKNKTGMVAGLAIIIGSASYTVWEIYTYLSTGDSFESMALTALKVVLGGFVILLGIFVYWMYKEQGQQMSEKSAESPVQRRGNGSHRRMA